MTVLVVAEEGGAGLAPAVAEVFTFARAVADSRSGRVSAAALGPSAERLARDLCSLGADVVFVDADDVLDQPLGETWVPALSRIVAEATPEVVVFAHTPVGADIAPRLAFVLGTGVATGCVGFEAGNGDIGFVRLCFGGKAREVIIMPTGSAVVTVKAKAYPAAEPDPARRTEMVTLPSVECPVPRVTVLGREAMPRAPLGLEEADVVVAGGRGLRNAAGFELAEELAATVGGVTAGTRVACDMGFCGPDRLIGLSGKSVAPELYFALGVSGAGQHMVGCSDAHHIVGVNNDPDAQIFVFCHYGIVGDCAEVLPPLIEEIRRLRAEDEGRRE